MSFDTKDMIVGNPSDISDTSLRLIETIAKGKEFSLNDQALNYPNELSIAIFNYPIIKNDKFKEFAEATKRISSAKYAYYKKSTTFKDSITKLILNTFNKHHQQENLNQADQILRVKTAEKMVKFIGFLYLSEFYSLENLVWFCDILRKNSLVSKISEECLATLIEIIIDQVNNESKQYKHNIHIAAIFNIIKDFECKNSQLKKNYKDLEIIEAVRKNKSLSSYSSKNEVVRQTKKIFEMVLSSSLPLEECIEKANTTNIIFQNSFESEILQLCVDYLKKSFETNTNDDMTTCSRIIMFIGKLFYENTISNESIKHFLSFLNRYIRLSKPFYNILISVIYNKIMNEGDEALKSMIPSDYVHEDFENDESTSDKEVENDIKECVVEVQVNGNDEQRPSASSSLSASAPQPTSKNKTKTVSAGENSEQTLIVTSINENASDPFEKFKEFLYKLSPTNISYILREISQIKFTSGEENIKKLATIIIDYAISKQTLIKPIIEIAVKLHETVVPHFNPSVMKKHLKAVISSKIFKCSERESTGCCQLVSELYKSNYCYDRFDVIILLESFTENFNNDRTALPSLLKFINELEDVIGSKKLSKNMKLKLQNVAQILTNKLNEDIPSDTKEGIENALKILRGETNSQKENRMKREDSNEEYVDVSDYRYDGAGEEYIISVENLPQNSAKITLVPSTKNQIKQQPEQQQQMPSQIPNSSSQNNFITSTSVQPPSPPFILPPMNIPPPIMLIAPPLILPNQTNRPQQQQPSLNQRSMSNTPPMTSASFPSLLETVENRRDSPIIRDDNSVRSLNENIVNDLNQSNISYNSAIDWNEAQINDNVSDYDTVSNAESYSIATGTEGDNDYNENGYSNLKNYRETINEEERFKNFVRNNLTCDINEIEKFAEAFLKRGVKCKNRGYIKLIYLIKEGLNGSEQLFNTFLQIFEKKIFDNIKIVSQKELLSLKERQKSLQLILLAAESYNDGLMKTDTIFASLDILYNNISNGKYHLITMFHQLIKITLDKVVEKGQQSIFKNYLDKLSKRVELLNDINERNLLTWEIYVTMKVLLYRTQEAKLKSPVECFKLFLNNLNAENFKISMIELKKKLVIDKIQLNEIVEIYISADRANYNRAFLVKVGSELKNLSAYGVEQDTFVKYLEQKAHNGIKYCLNNVKENENMVILINWISFIGDLYLGYVVSISLILCSLEMMLEKEILNMKIADAISILIRKVGFKLDQESVYILDKFFGFFKHITNKENSYRSFVYKNLIKLRANNWILMEREMDVEKIEESLRKICNENEREIGKILSNLIDKSSDILLPFMEIFWKFILTNPESMLIYAKLTLFISCNHENFQFFFMGFLRKRNQTFENLSKHDKISNNIIAKLSTVTCFIAYCYLFNCASENDMILWLKPNFIKHFSVKDKTDLQIMLGQKVNESNNNELKGLLGLIEYETKQYIFSTLESVKTNLMEWGKYF